MALFDWLGGKGLIQAADADFADDPVCRKRVEVRRAPGGDSRHGHGVYYFCSWECRTKFDDDPHRWLGHHLH